MCLSMVKLKSFFKHIYSEYIDIHALQMGNIGGICFEAYIYTNFVSLPYFFNEKYCSCFLMMPYSTYMQVSHNITGNISTALHKVLRTRSELTTLYDLPAGQSVSIAHRCTFRIGIIVLINNKLFFVHVYSHSLT